MSINLTRDVIDLIIDSKIDMIIDMSIDLTRDVIDLIIDMIL
jgi:hypothetical protein